MLIKDCFLIKNIDFVPVNENFDTSASFDWAMIGILSVFVQLEEDQTAECFTMGHVGKAKNGHLHRGGSAPTEYNYIDGEFIISDYKALQVRDLHNRFLKGCSVHNC